MNKNRPAVIVIYAPTRRAAHGLRDRLIEMYEKAGPVKDIEETHWIAAGDDSADTSLSRRSKADQKPARSRKAAGRTGSDGLGVQAWNKTR